MAIKTPVLDPRNSHGPFGHNSNKPDMLARNARRAKQNARTMIRNLRRGSTATVVEKPKCDLHPNYQGKLAPRSKAAACTCRAVYEAQKASK